jgi:hypothetical protein
LVVFFMYLPFSFLASSSFFTTINFFYVNRDETGFGSSFIHM